MTHVKTSTQSQLKTCSRGHTYQRSSDCPICPICWPGYYKEHGSRDFDILAAPAQRALHNAGIKSLVELASKTESEVSALHGMGPNAIAKLKQALSDRDLSFSTNHE